MWDRAVSGRTRRPPEGRARERPGGCPTDSCTQGSGRTHFTGDAPTMHRGSRPSCRPTPDTPRKGDPECATTGPALVPVHDHGHLPCVSQREQRPQWSHLQEAASFTRPPHFTVEELNVSSPPSGGANYTRCSLQSLTGPLGGVALGSPGAAGGAARTQAPGGGVSDLANFPAPPQWLSGGCIWPNSRMWMTGHQSE